MPLHGKIVVIKRSGTDGTEFPLTANCLFGRKPDCDIRIQLPQVSKEHCRIDLNENKEVVLTNLSSVNPTRVNGEILQQSERLKHGDVITIIDRSFRFEYPPAPTPKKRSSTGNKTKTLKVLQDPQLVEAVAETGDKRISEVFTDGTNHDNIKRSLEKTIEFESKEDDGKKTSSPFGDLYQMIRKSLDVKTPQRSSTASLLQIPSAKFCTPKLSSVKKAEGKLPTSMADKSTPKKDEAKVMAGAAVYGTPRSLKKRRESSQLPTKIPGSATEGVEEIAMSEAPMRRKSKDATPAKPVVTENIKEPTSAQKPRRASPKNVGTAEKEKKLPKKRKSGELSNQLPSPQRKKKRVSFGGYLSPELFDKRLPPNSPLCKGATPRRSLCLLKPKQSLLRRASVIGLVKECDSEQQKVKSPKKQTLSPKKSPTAKKASPKAATPEKKSPKSKTPSPKASSTKVKTPTSKSASPGEKTPKSRSSSPKAASPGTKTTKSRSSSPKAASPGTKTPKSRPSSPKAASPGTKTPKSRSASPKAASPGTKTPKSRSSSPKATSPGTKTPKSRSSSPKATSPGTKTPKSRSASPKAVSPGNKTPTSKASPKTPAGVTKIETPGKTPVNPDTRTPTVQGRFSVSRISTPSPVSEDASSEQMPTVGVTPKIPLRRKSTKKKTPSVSRSAVKVMRRSGISRASMKVKTSFADIVKFGRAKANVVAPAKKQVIKKPTKKAVPKPQTPARKLQDYVSTGHADSPMTIVVGRAHKRQVVQPIGAAPRVVTNVVLDKKNMKMDEDLTGISEMFKTPANGRRRKSVMDKSVTESPKGIPSTPLVEPSVLNTPEEPGEMMVSPLSVLSTAKGRRFNSEAVQRLLDEEDESSFINEVPVLEIEEESSDPQSAEGPVKTPQQKPEQPLSLTGVKRIMRTPRQKAEPLEDLRGKLLKTPKQKPEQKDCLTGVKRIMKTPRDKVESVEDIRGNLLVTPKQKPEPRDCLTGVKEIFDIPQWEDQAVEDLQGKLESLEASEVEGMSPVAPEVAGMLTPNVKASQMECLTGVKRIMKTPKEKGTPVEDMVGVKRIMKTPREKSESVEDMVGVKRVMKTPRQKAEPVEDNFGIKRLVKSPRLRGNAPVEDFEGLQQLMEEPVSERPEEATIVELEDQVAPDCDADIPQEANVVDQTNEELPEEDGEPTIAQETVSNAVVHSVPVEQPNEGAEVQNLPEEQAEEETTVDTVTEISAVVEPVAEKNPVRGRRARAAEPKVAEDNPEAPQHAEVTEAPAPVRGRRGKKPEATATPTVRQTTRRRIAKTDTQDIEVSVEEITVEVPKAAIKTKRGRNTRKALEAEIVQDDGKETEVLPEAQSEQNIPVDDHPTSEDHVVSEEKLDSKPKRGRNMKETEVCESVPEQSDLNTDSPEVCDDSEVVPTGNDDNKPSEVMETVSQATVTETLPDAEADKDASTALKKSTRGTRAKMPEINQEQEDKSEDISIAAPVRGRRGRKIEAVAPTAARQTTRTRKAKQESTSKDNSEIVPEKSAETQPTAEENKTEENETPVQEAVVKPRRGRKAAQPPAVPPEPEKADVGNVSQEEIDSVAEVAVVKLARGRKAKSTPVQPPQPEPEKTEDVIDLNSLNAAQEEKESPEVVPVRPTRGRRTKQTPASEVPQTEPEKTEADEPVMEEPPQNTPVAKKPRRGRKLQCDDVEQHDVTAVLEAKQESQPPVRAKRGRNAKLEEKVMEDSTDLVGAEETVKKLKQARKTEPDDVEPREEIQTEEVVPQEAEVTSAVEPQEIIPVSVKPRRGRPAKQCHDGEIPESRKVKEAPAVKSRKPRQTRRGVAVEEDVAAVEVLEEKSENLTEAEESTTEPDPPVTKPVKRKGVKTAVKDESSAKRARRGATAPPPEEASTEPELQLSVTNPVEPPKRGRRAAAVTKPKPDEPPANSDLPDPSDDSNAAVVEDPKAEKRSVRWKSDMEVFDLPESTPVKPVRGRKMKLVEQESKVDTSKSEEKDLSGEVVEVQPMKKARRGAKVNEKPKTDAEPESQPQTRRGRSARK